MLDSVLSTVIASALVYASSLMPTNHAVKPMSFTKVLPQNKYVAYTVQPEDTFQYISLKYYGSTDYWKNVSNDNDSISDPSTLKSGQLLAIRAEKPEKVEEPVPTVAPVIEIITPAISQAPTQAPVQPVAVTSNGASPISEEALTYLGNCEAGMNPARNSGNGYYGAFQFSYGTWKSMNTGYERADLAPIEVQKAAVRQLLQRSSIYNQFPACANKMRNAGLI